MKDLDDFLADISAEYSAVMQDKNIELTVNCQDGLVGQMDKGLVHGVLDNAISNAVVSFFILKIK